MKTPLPRRRTAIALVSIAMLAGACTGGDETAPTPSPTTTSPSPTATPTPTPTPTPTLEPVKGKRNVSAHSVSSARVLGLGSAKEPNRKAINRAANQVANWLDRHLDRLQTEGRGRLGQVGGGSIGNKKQRRVLNQLASPDRPVASAGYNLIVHHDGAPTMVVANVVVRHPEGRPSRQQMVFLVRDDGPVLAMFGPPGKDDQ